MSQSKTEYGYFRMNLESLANPSVMVALRCLTDARLLWLLGKIWLPWQQELVRSSLNDTITLPDPKTLIWCKNIAHYLIYKPSYSQFYVQLQIANFLLPLQQRSVVGQF